MPSQPPEIQLSDLTRPEELFTRLEKGEITAAQAIRLMEELERGGYRPMKPTKAEDTPTLAETLAELDVLVGMAGVKKLTKELRAFVEIQKRRREENLATEPLVLHMVFRGNPGTGKTTVARIFGRLFKEMGVLPKGHLVEVERADLVGEYIGHTAQKTREQLKRAMGGILFIDEAYSLARGGEKDFGKEVIDTLVKHMEDHKEEFILILAGYPSEMEWFMRINPGLRSRFPIQIDFPDYGVKELLEIAETMLKQRQYQLAPDAKTELVRQLTYHSMTDGNFANARLVRNIIERGIRRQAVRLVKRGQLTRDELITIHAADVTEENEKREST